MMIKLEKVLKTGISFLCLTLLLGLAAEAQFVQVNVFSKFGSTSADGFGTAAMLNRPAGVCADSRGFIYIADKDNHCIRRYTNSTGLTTIAGVGSNPGYRDGAALTALFDSPMDLASSVTGDSLFVVDFGNSRIRMINLITNTVSTIAGGANNPVNVDDVVGTQSRFSLPFCVELWGRHLIVVERNSNPFGRVRKIDLFGTNSVQTLSSGGFFSNPLVPVSLVEVNDITLGPNNQFFAVGNTANSILTFNPFTGVNSVYAGTGLSGNTDGPLLQASFRFPWGIDWDGNQTLYITDQNHRVRTIGLATGLVSTLAGSNSGILDGQGVNARFSNPAGIVVAPGNQIFVADQLNNRLRQVDPQGNVITRAGSFPFVDGTGLGIRFNNPRGLAIWRDTVLFVADRGNHIIRKVNVLNERSNVFAGIGTVGNLDGNWNASTFQSPSACLAYRDTLYVADGNARIRKISLTGSGLDRGFVTTLTTGMQLGNGNVGMVVYRDTLFLTEAQRNRIIKIALYGPQAGRVQAFVGGGVTGSQSGYNEGYGTTALFTNPTALAIFRDTLFIGDDRRLIRKVALSGPDYGITSYFSGNSSSITPRGGRDTTVSVAGLTALMIDSSNKVMFAACTLGRVIGLAITGPDKGLAYEVSNNQNSTIIGIADGQGNTPTSRIPLGAKIANVGAFAFQDSLRYWYVDEEGSRVRMLQGVIPNSPPSFSLLNLVRRREDTALRTVRNVAFNLKTGTNPGERAQRLSFRVNFTNGAIFRTAPTMVIDSLPTGERFGHLVFRTQPFANGTSILRIRLFDNGGTNNGGVDSSEQLICTLVVVPVNQPPTYSLAGNNPIITTTGLFANVFNGYLSNVTPGHFTEGNQLVTATVTSSNPLLFSVQPDIQIVGTGNNRAGNLTFTPTATDTGTVTLFIKLTDNGGIDSGGVDTSVISSVVLKLRPQVNTPPSFIGGANQVAINVPVRRTVPGWIIAITPGTYSYEVTQTLSYSIRVSNPNAFTPMGQPMVTPQNIGALLGGELSYTPAGTFSGIVQCTLIIRDNGGTANGGIDSTTADFTITLNPSGIWSGLANNLLTYPNPFEKDLVLEGLQEGTYSFEWFNLQGKSLLKEEIKVEAGQKNLTISPILSAKQTYILKISSGKFSRLMKLVKQ